MKDYVLSIFKHTYTSMPLTKTTPRKKLAVCPVCMEEVDAASFRYHVVICVSKDYGCDEYKTSFSKKS